MMKKLILTAAAAIVAISQAFAQNLVEGKIEGVTPQGSYTPSFKYDGEQKAPLNIILMIGDGTGLAQIASGYYANGGTLTVMNLRTMGLVTTCSASHFTTDSAASGTAYATGHKTHNHAVGVDVNDKTLPNIPEILAPVGIVSGIVSTDDLHGATPASFFAHQPHRKMTDEIWADLPSSKLAFFAAGSEEKFAERPAGTQEAIRKEFTIVSSLDSGLTKGAARVGYLPPKSETQSMKYGRGDFLPASTKFAIDFLMNHRTGRKKGFFLMVEGARIDKSCHKNDFPSAVKEMLDFDKAIEAAIRFAEKDGNTLVLISADHETGGLSLNRNGVPEEGTVEGRFVTRGHTPIPVPIFAYGPHSQDFMGVQGNDEVARKIIKLLRGK